MAPAAPALLWLCIGAPLLPRLEAARVRGRPAAGPRPAARGYNFERFVQDFGRSYAPHGAEYHRRAGLFEESLAQIHSVNIRNAAEGRHWVAGVHKFMDWTDAERRSLHGYKPSSVHRRTAALQVGASASTDRRAAAGANRTARRADVDSVEDQGPPLWDQGNCGSCWAISAVEAVEAQLMKQNGGMNTRLSAQALVDCVPNPRKCGGSGGCDGATGELAYEYMRDHGIPVDAEAPYTGRTGVCGSSFLQSTFTGTRARVGGWTNLPSNQAGPMKQALVETGPIVVAVDGGDWFNYDAGIFDGCPKDAVLSHAVLLKGYGDEGGKKYWTIQNSWGRDWGEHGDIRLLQHDDDRAYCGWDSKPTEGVGCEGGPPKVEVCGMCGLLYDPVVPTGVYLEHGGGGYDGAAAAAPPADGSPFALAAAADPFATAAATDAPETTAAPRAATTVHNLAEAELEAIVSSMKV